jgi:hypothetical protein
MRRSPGSSEIGKGYKDELVLWPKSHPIL